MNTEEEKRIPLSKAVEEAFPVEENDFFEEAFKDYEYKEKLALGWPML